MIKKLVFVSVPMKDKKTDEVERSLQIARNGYIHVKKVNAKEIAFIDNFDHGMSDDRYEECANPRVEYLGRAIKRLALCDEAVFGIGWKDANGCCIEHEVCQRYGIPIIDLEKVKKIVKIDKETKEVKSIEWVLKD